MCGIFGFNWMDKHLLKRGLKKISHRGPDDSGIYLGDNVSLGHNRLSIVDLSSLGRQPMCNENKKIWIVFNGEIYNYLVLKKNLKKKHIFNSRTDTEVLIHLYEEDYFDMLKKLQGMFSFCIYDSEKKIFFLARDRVGIKPLYYYCNSNKFIFSSEIKAILEEKRITPLLNYESLNSFLIFRANTLENTFFQNIKKLMPGHFLIYDLKNNSLKIKKYWDVSFEEKKNTKEYYSNRLRELLEDSVKIRLMSDVPYGSYLSGGVDSGIITSLMKKYSKKRVKTFSVGFKEEEHSETKEARFLSSWLKTDHHELTLTAESIKSLPEIIYQADEPLADPTSIPIYFLSKYSKKYCTVILTGEGSDELFAGYPQYKFMKLHSEILSHLPRSSKKLLEEIIKKTPPIFLDKIFKFSSSLGEKGIERFSKYLNSEKTYEQYFNQISIFNREEQRELLGLKIDPYKPYKKYFNKSSKKNIVSQCEFLEFKEQMVEDLLMKIDKNTMAFAIEGRVPFLDYRVVELAAQIPENFKINFFKDKDILRFTFRDALPKETLYRKKRHFFVPIDLWLTKYLESIKQKMLSEKYIKKQGIFNYDYIKKIDEGFEKSRLFYSRQLWALLTFQIWYSQYIEGKKVCL